MKKLKVEKMNIIALISAIGAALTAKLACPICWPAYAALASALGLGFLINTKNLLIISIIFLLVAIGVLYGQCRKRKNFRPFWIGLVGASFILVGKFVLDNLIVLYGGAILLIFACIHNILDSWLKREEKVCMDCDNKIKRR